MEKAELVKAIAEKLQLSPLQVNDMVNEVISELISPYIFRKPGEMVGLLDNSCTNNCKSPTAEINTPTA